MKGLIRGAAGLAVVLAMSACSKDETIDLMGPPTGVQATPVSAFTLKGDSVAILLRLVNDRNQSVPTEFTISGVGPALQVVYDDKYRPDYSNGDTLIAPAIKPQQRYFARGFNVGKSTFTATAGGFSTVVTVVVSPKSLEAALNKTTGLIAGDTVTITAPAGLKFTPASTVTLATGAIAIASRAADSSNIKIILGPGAGGIATVTNVFRDYAPTLALMTLATTNAIATTPAVSVAPTTASNLTPQVGVPITLTLGGGLRFIATSKVLIGGIEAGIQSVSADSTTATVMPMMTSAGNVTYTNVALSFLTSVPLALPGDKTITVGATYGGATDPNSGSIATASTIALPPVGRSFVYSDGPGYVPSAACTLAGNGDGCKFYKIVLTAATTLDFQYRWQGGAAGADMGLYRFSSAGTGPTAMAGCDNGGQGSTGQPENCTAATLAAGTYYIGLVYFGALSYGGGANPAPTFTQFRITAR